MYIYIYTHTPGMIVVRVLKEDHHLPTASGVEVQGNQAHVTRFRCTKERNLTDVHKQALLWLQTI